MQKLDQQTLNFTDEHIANIAAMFPHCVTEVEDENGTLKKAIDFDLLKQELSANIVEGPKERYRIDWPGKRASLVSANTPITKTLRPAVEESVNFDTTENLYIEGDNLEALKLLQESYLGAIKMIYIDPPYNTGKDFVYKDNFTRSKEEELQESGQVDEEGGRLVANLESNGRFHSDWLSMMYPRLKLARNLLKDDGVIVLSIDDNEVHNLRKICDDIFGESNFIGEMIWAAGKKNDSKYISISHEYMLVYVKNSEFLNTKKTTWRKRKEGLDDIYKMYEKLKRTYGTDYKSISQSLKKWFAELPDSNPAKRQKHYSRVDAKGIYFPDNISSQSGASRPRYQIPHPVTKEFVTVPSRGWGYTLETLERLIKEDKVEFGDDHTTVPTLKSYLKDRELEVPYSVFYKDGRAATKRLASLVGKKVFENPKDETIISEIIEFSCTDDEIILDFFSGSASTAHAVMQLNAEDRGNRKFILVQLPEETDEKSEAYKSGYKTIAEIGKERIRRAGKKIKEENADKEGIEDLDIGFRVLKIDESNMKDIYFTPDAVDRASLFDTVDHIKEDRTPEDLLFGVLVDWGVDLTLPIRRETIHEKTVFFVGHDDLTACFDEDLDVDFIKELAGRDAMRVVFKESGFKDDETKINAEQIFTQLSPGTDLRVI